MLGGTSDGELAILQIQTSLFERKLKVKKSCFLEKEEINKVMCFAQHFIPDFFLSKTILKIQFLHSAWSFNPVVYLHNSVSSSWWITLRLGIDNFFSSIVPQQCLRLMFFTFQLILCYFYRETERKVSVSPLSFIFNYL